MWRRRSGPVYVHPAIPPLRVMRGLRTLPVRFTVESKAQSV